MGGPGRKDMAGPSTHHDLETDEPDDGSRPDWLRRGETIGRYMVLECLGVGGMGVIYSAWDPKLDRKLAIKIVRDRHSRTASERSRARLLREGQALARLRHPNVISVHDVGTHLGRVFVAMEFVEGQTLQRWLLRSPRPQARELIDVFLQVGRGLAAAHRAGLVHRDVKPENVMIGVDGRVLVLDFGIAREHFGTDSEVIDEPSEHEADDAAALAVEDDAADADLDDDDDADAEDRPSARRGSGTAGDDDDDGDGVERGGGGVAESGVPLLIIEDHTPLVALTRTGAVIGTPAYMSPEQHRGQPVDARSDQFSYCVAMWEALNGEKPFGEGSRQRLLARMRLGQLRSFRNREVPRRIVVALQRGLAWQPKDRFPNMEALLGALNPRGQAERRFWQGLGLGAVGGMVIAVFTTLVSVGLPSRRPVAPSIDTPRCERVGDELAAVWNDARAEAIAGRFRAAGRERASASWVRARERLDGWAAHWLEQRKQTCAAHFVEQRDSAIQHDRRVACADAQRERFAELLTALEHADADMIDGAITAVVALPSPELCADHQQLDALDRATALPDSSTARQRIAEIGRELERLELLVAAGSPALTPSPTRDPRILPHAGSGGWRTELERSRQLTTAAREARHPPTLARALLIHAEFLRQAGEFDEAEDTLLEAASAAAVAGVAPMQIRALGRAAALISEHERQREARRWLELALALAASNPHERALDVELGVTEAVIEQREGLPERARERLLKLATQLEHDGDASLQLPTVLHQLALATAAAGDRPEAVQLLRRALALHEQVHGPKHVGVLALRRDLARLLAQIGEHRAALGELDRAIELATRIHADGRDAARLHAQRGALLASVGRCEEASTALALAHASAPDSAIEAEILEAHALACGPERPRALESAEP